MLQRRGLVDAVMTQDVDAIMFGSGLTLRDWSKEGKAKSNTAPTHVSVFDLEKLKEISRGLEPEGMILVALLSGGDYDQEGVTGIGSVLACEIARAGFGADLLDLIRTKDEEGIQEWRERLQCELETNESGYFKIKRKSVKIPEDFPNRKILHYYMNPAVTDEAELAQLERKWNDIWGADIDVQVLREYTGATFDWRYKPGAWHFVRNLAPALLPDRLRRATAGSLITSESQITERRRHFDSDGLPELRVTMVPADVVGLDLEAERDSPEYLAGLAAAAEEEYNENVVEDGGDDVAVPASTTKKRKTAPWRPWNPEKMWIAESLVELGARKHVERWNQIQWEIENDAKTFATRKCAKKKTEKQKSMPGGMEAGALDKYTVATKSISRIADPMKTASDPESAAFDNLLAPVEEPLPLSPTRPRANTKSRRRIRSPSKLKPATRLERGSSPLIPDQFRVSRRNQGEQPEPLSLTTPANLVGAGLNKDDDPFTSTDKLSRPPTSSPVDTTLQKAKTRSTLQTNSTQSIGSESAPQTTQEPRLISKDPFSRTMMESTARQDSFEDLRPDSLSPLESDAGSDDQALEVLPLRDTLRNITQRSPKRRAKQGQPPAKHKPSTSSPGKTERPPGDFFKPYVKSAELPQPQPPTLPPPKPRSQHAGFTAVPPELSTGLESMLTVASQLSVIPRSSLPGTWKEIESGSALRSPVIPSEASRPPRVSIVDLTAD